MEVAIPAAPAPTTITSQVSGVAAVAKIADSGSRAVYEVAPTNFGNLGSFGNFRNTARLMVHREEPAIGQAILGEVPAVTAEKFVGSRSGSVLPAGRRYANRA